MAQGGGGTPAPLTERPYSKVQLFCSNLPWSVNGKVRVSFYSAALPLAPSLPQANSFLFLLLARRVQMLRQAFEEFGEVVDAFVAYNGRSSRGFGYVTFKNPPDASAALEAQQVRDGARAHTARTRAIGSGRPLRRHHAVRRHRP